MGGEGLEGAVCGFAGEEFWESAMWNVVDVIVCTTSFVRSSGVSEAPGAFVLVGAHPPVTCVIEAFDPPTEAVFRLGLAIGSG